MGCDGTGSDKTRLFVVKSNKAKDKHKCVLTNVNSPV